MSTLSPLEQSLYNIGKGALPSYLFTDAEDNEVLAAFAKQLAPVWEHLALQVQDTFIAVARTVALDQHAKDRGTRRQLNETDEALSERLRFLTEDSVTLAAIIARTIDVLNTYGVTIPTGYPGITELRRDRMYYGRGAGLQITCIAAALISEGETFSISGHVYEFNKTGGVTAGNIAVDISAATTATDVATAVLLAMVSQYAGLTSQSAQYALISRATGPIADTVANAGFVMRRKHSYYSRGFRYTAPGRGGTVVVVMLPYGTPVEAQASVAEALRQIKAGGVKVIVERRLNP